MAPPTLFLSHAHSDKQVARRLVRRLTAHGIKVWIDESELQFGAVLTSSLRSRIEDADVLLVIVSRASAQSRWVGLELDFAREHDKPVIPFFLEPLAEHERFRDHLGVDATSPQSFADAVHCLMRDLFRSFDLELPPADPALLTEGLRALAKEETGLAPLINGCLDSEGLHQENMETVFKVTFSSLDEALNALFDLRPNESIAYHAAYGFSYAGAGTRALFSWIAATGSSELPLVTALGGRPLAPALIPTAIELLGACVPPNNHALYSFIHHHAAALDDPQRRAVIRLVTWPMRADTSRLADTLGWVALKAFPDSAEIQRTWCRWIDSGAFDDSPTSPRDLARYLAKAHTETLGGWERVNEALRGHVRQYLRSADKGKVMTAVGHIRAAADAGAPVLATLLREAEGVSGTAEWNDWKQHDPETAEWTSWYVLAFANEARGERNWLRARESIERTVAFEEKRRLFRANDERETDGDR